MDPIIQEEVRRTLEDVTLDPTERENCFRQNYADGIFGAGVTEADARTQFATELYDQNRCLKYILNFLPYAKQARDKRAEAAQIQGEAREQEQTNARHNQIHYNRAVGIATFSLAAILGSCAMDVSPESKQNFALWGGAAAVIAGPLLVLYGLRKRA